MQNNLYIACVRIVKIYLDISDLEKDNFTSVMVDDFYKIGDINHPINNVKPGDYCIGDRDGLIFIPKENIEGVLDQAEEAINTEDLIRKNNPVDINFYIILTIFFILFIFHKTHKIQIKYNPIQMVYK